MKRKGKGMSPYTSHLILNLSHPRNILLSKIFWTRYSSSPSITSGGGGGCGCLPGIGSGGAVVSLTTLKTGCKRRIGKGSMQPRYTHPSGSQSSTEKILPRLGTSEPPFFHLSHSGQPTSRRSSPKRGGRCKGTLLSTFLSSSASPLN